MKYALSERFQVHHPLTPGLRDFLARLEQSIGQDLWESAGGPWSENSVNRFCDRAMAELAGKVQNTDLDQAIQTAWQDVVRDFHKSYWGETRLAKKEKKAKTPEQKIFWELFSYIWMLLQAALITKTVVFYLGIKSAQEDSAEGKVYVILAILFSFCSLIFFAYRKSKKNPDKET